MATEGRGERGGMLIDAEMRAFVRSPLRSLVLSFGIKQTGAIDYERTRSRRSAMHEQVRRARIQSDSTGCDWRGQSTKVLSHVTRGISFEKEGFFVLGGLWTSKGIEMEWFSRNA